MNCILYQDWLHQWMDYKKAIIKPSTYATYSNIIFNQILPLLGSYPIYDITSADLQQFTYFWRTHSLGSKNGLSESTIRNALMLIKLSLKDFQLFYQKSLPPCNIQLPKTSKSPFPKTLSSADQSKLTMALINNPTLKNCGILLALYTGIRIGELCALTWNDINFANPSISINKTLQRILIKSSSHNHHSEIIITPPKSASSIRVVPIPQALIPLLKTHEPDNPQFYVLTASIQYTEPRVYRLYYMKLLKSLSISHLAFHGLRHTFATNLISKGADVKTVSELLGHSVVTTTLNLYTHPSFEHKKNCINLLSL